MKYNMESLTLQVDGPITGRAYKPGGGLITRILWYAGSFTSCKVICDGVVFVNVVILFTICPAVFC